MTVLANNMISRPAKIAIGRVECVTQYVMILENRNSRLGQWRKIVIVFHYVENFNQVFYSAAALLAMQSAVIPTAILSVCPSVCHMLVPYPDE